MCKFIQKNSCDIPQVNIVDTVSIAPNEYSNGIHLAINKVECTNYSVNLVLFHFHTTNGFFKLTTLSHPGEYHNGTGTLI